MKIGSLLKQLNGHPSYIFAALAVLILIVAFLIIRKEKFTTKKVAVIGVALALAYVLSLFKLFKAPFGGSVTLGSMVPIIFIALVYGPETGIFTGFIFGILDLMLDPYIVHPIQLLFDYPFAFMALGLAGYIKKINLSTKLIKHDVIVNILATIFAVFGRFICHFISGVVFFASDTPKGMNVYAYSALYNLGYLGVDLIICIIIIALLPLDRIAKSLNR